MHNLFKKAVVFTDLHIGLKSNSTVHNDDCLKFVTWAIETAQAQGCDTAIMMGDWHNNRASINIVSLNYSLRCIELLNQAFGQVYIIPGNHDLYYRDRRDTNSVEWAKHLPNITLINDFVTVGDVTFAPWLVGDDYKKIKGMSGRYMFGHFELPSFYMNAMVQMPDHGEIQLQDFQRFETVFSGHFHKRQTGKNITYIGNCFPHNYSDAGDDQRGIMILEWGQEPQYHSWPDQPVYRVYNLSDVLDRPDSLLRKGMHARINLDIDISYEEAGFIKETFMESHQLREIKLIPQHNTEFENMVAQGNIAFQSVDQIVSGQLTNISSEHYNNRLLLEIYQNL